MTAALTSASRGSNWRNRARRLSEALEPGFPVRSVNWKRGDGETQPRPGPWQENDTLQLSGCKYDRRGNCYAELQRKSLMQAVYPGQNLPLSLFGSPSEYFLNLQLSWDKTSTISPIMPTHLEEVSSRVALLQVDADTSKSSLISYLMATPRCGSSVSSLLP
jgi:hypothetical protein